MYPQVLSWPVLVVFQNNFKAQMSTLLLEITIIVSYGPCSRISGPKGRMVFLSLIFGVQRLVT